MGIVRSDPVLQTAAGAAEPHIRNPRFALVVCTAFVLTVAGISLRQYLGVKLGFIMLSGAMLLVLVFELSEQAAMQATNLARCFNSRITLLHAIEHFPGHLPHYKMPEEGMDPEHFLINRSSVDLEVLARRLEIQDAGTDVILSTHSAKSEIVKYTREHKVDLMILGGGGDHGLADLLGGSTAAGVVRASPCDVLTVVNRSS
ncbi:MAG: universal stress protein [Gammaproteobacteria bacterium]|jgi:universal stress protein A